jgi:hypothetical protein
MKLMQQQEQLNTIIQQGASPREQDPAFESIGPSQKKSNHASTGVLADDALLLDDAPMARYPVDDTQRSKIVSYIRRWQTFL